MAQKKQVEKLAVCRVDKLLLQQVKVMAAKRGVTIQAEFDRLVRAGIKHG